MLARFLPLFILLLIAVPASVWTGKLTLPAALVGGAIGILVFAGAGYSGLGMLAAFFILGTAATSWQWEKKARDQLQERNKGKRTTGQVIANGGVAALCGLGAIALPVKASSFHLMMACSLSAATADTLSSELGMTYGTRFYSIRNFGRGTKGQNGVISWEGTALGTAGSFIIAGIYALGFGWNSLVLVVIVSGLVGNLIDSVLGAVLENRGYLSNDAVNFLSTLCGAAVGGLLSAFVH